jgi:hypothetical protein
LIARRARLRSEIYTAVIDDGVRTLEQFRRWIADRGLPEI